MEVRAHFIVVGAFFLLTLAATLLAILWLSRENSGSKMKEYDIWFQESVSGLSVGNAVLFSGIRVGAVSQIKISEKEPGAVRVRVSINGDTPVREDSTATLSLQGITGVSVVAITGGTKGSPIVTVPEGEVGRIRSEKSPLAAVVKDASNITARLDRVLENLEDVTSKDNRDAVKEILASTAALSSSLSSRTRTLENGIDRIDESLIELRGLLAGANRAVNHYETLGQNLNTLSTTLNTEVGGFSRETLPQVRQLVAELRTLVHTFNRIGQNLESDPRQYLLGDPVKEYAP